MSHSPDPSEPSPLYAHISTSREGYMGASPCMQTHFFASPPKGTQDTDNRQTTSPRRTQACVALHVTRAVHTDISITPHMLPVRHSSPYRALAEHLLSWHFSCASESGIRLHALLGVLQLYTLHKLLLPYTSTSAAYYMGNPSQYRPDQKDL